MLEPTDKLNRRLPVIGEISWWCGVFTAVTGLCWVAAISIVRVWFDSRTAERISAGTLICVIAGWLVFGMLARYGTRPLWPHLLMSCSILRPLAVGCGGIMFSLGIGPGESSSLRGEGFWFTLVGCYFVTLAIEVWCLTKVRPPAS